MEYYFAPMEGLTNRIFRRVHHRHFPGTDRYYIPFLSPTSAHEFTTRELRELLPEAAGDVPAVPQLLCKSVPDFLWAAQALQEQGYEEVNLNLGCPSGTVVAKGKGAGLLGKPEALDAFLDGIFACCPIRISLKTRIGLRSPGEFETLLPIFERYPLSRLIIHPRTRTEMYRGEVHRDVFAWAAERSALPLCYNGDLVSAAGCRSLAAAFPRLEAVMIGRGLVANPALIREAKGGAPLGLEELRAFYGELREAYCDAFGPGNAMHRLKEVWACLRWSFVGSERIAGRIARAKSPQELDAWAEAAFAQLPLIPRQE